MHVNRVKNGLPSTHPIGGPELRALGRLQKEYKGPYVFSTERGGPMTTSTVRKLMVRAGEQARLPAQFITYQTRNSVQSNGATSAAAPGSSGE